MALKVGDRVKIVKNLDPFHTIGLEGEVVAIIHEDERTYIGVDHDKPFSGSHYCHDGNFAYAKKGNGLWYFEEEYLQKILSYREVPDDELSSIIG